MENFRETFMYVQERAFAFATGAGMMIVFMQLFISPMDIWLLAAASFLIFMFALKLFPSDIQSVTDYARFAITVSLICILMYVWYAYDDGALRQMIF